MKSVIKWSGIIAFVAIIGFSFAACGGGKTLNSPEELEAYLDSQSANSPDKPIKVTMSANGSMLPEIEAVIKNADKYVSLNLSGNALTTIPRRAFQHCETLVSITIPNSVTSIEDLAFWTCDNLISVTFQGTITESNFKISAFAGGNMASDLRDKYLYEGIGTYTRPNGFNTIWTKK